MSQSSFHQARIGERQHELAQDLARAQMVRVLQVEGARQLHGHEDELEREVDSDVQLAVEALDAGLASGGEEPVRRGADHTLEKQFEIES